MNMCAWFKKIFGRKGGSSNSEGPPQFECIHTWKDFPWYIVSVYRESEEYLTVQVYEPYVCIHCKKRKDVCLDTYHRYNICSRKDAEAEIDKIEKNLEGRTKPKVIIEDMIHDYIYVDREKLGIIERLKDLKTAPKMEEVKSEE